MKYFLVIVSQLCLLALVACNQDKEKRDRDLAFSILNSDDTNSKSTLDKSELEVLFKALKREDLIPRLEEFIKQHDKNGDGHIDRNEFDDILNGKVSDGGLLTGFEGTKAAENNEISGEEVIRVLLLGNIKDEDKIKIISAIFDKDGNGKITSDELEQELLSHHIEKLKAADVNNDKEITDDELANYLKAHPDVKNDIIAHLTQN